MIMSKGKGSFQLTSAILVSTWMLLLSMQALAEEAKDSEREYWSHPGKLIDIGTHRLHINCTDRRQTVPVKINPTVVIDSGLGGFSLEWKKLQSLLANQFRVCTYDRAGYGWSDPGPFPRTTRTIVRELKTLLKQAQIEPPYILAGHSFGGYNMMYYAKKFPADVAGLVLLDSSHPEQFEWFPPVFPDKIQSRSRQKYISIPRLPQNYPQDKKELAFHLMNSRKARRTLRYESMNFEISARQVAKAGALPQIPLVVLTRGERAWPNTPKGEENETNWTRLQNMLARMVKDSTHQMAKFSGHFIHLDQPLLVKSSIEEVAWRYQCRQLEKQAIYTQLKQEVKWYTVINTATAGHANEPEDDCRFDSGK